MNIIPSIIALLLLPVLALFTFLFFKAREEAKKHGTGTLEEFAGICAVAIERKAEKEKRKERILEILKRKKEAGNQELREALNVSRQAIVKYTSELEKEGKIRQVGQAGRWVVYRITPRM